MKRGGQSPLSLRISSKKKLGGLDLDLQMPRSGNFPDSRRTQLLALETPPIIGGGGDWLLPLSLKFEAKLLDKSYRPSLLQPAPRSAEET